MIGRLKQYGLAALFGLLPTTASLAQDPYEAQILAQLEAVSAALVNAGYTGLLGDGGLLDHQTHEDYSVNLRAGATYAIVGVCDEDCFDIDLAIYDGYGNLITEDQSEDDAPVVEFTATSGGQFTLRVTMYHCSNNPCYYGVGLYAY